MKPDGRLVVTDAGNQRLRAVDAPLPRYWATAQDIVFPDENCWHIHAFHPSGRPQIGGESARGIV